MKKNLLKALIIAVSGIITLSAKAQYVGTYVNTGTGSTPTGITRDNSGNFYVALRGLQKVIKIDPQLNITDYCTNG